MESFKWSNKIIEQFLRIYMKHPCLWDFNHENYVSKVERYMAHENILSEMSIPGMDINSLKRKIHSIRNTYTNERRKIERSKQMEPDNVYKPRIRWYYLADQFLGRIALSRRKLAAANSLMTAIGKRAVSDCHDRRRLDFKLAPYMPVFHSDVNIYATEGAVRSNWPETQLQDKTTDRTKNGFSGSCPAITDVTFNVETSPRNFPEMIWKAEPVDIPDENGLEEIAEVFEQHEPPEAAHLEQPQEDELEAFSRSVYLQMRRLPEKYNIDLMAEIQRLISAKRRQYLHAQAKCGTPHNWLS